MKIKHLLHFILLLPLMGGCFFYQEIETPFKNQPPPPPPQYNNADHWISLPFKRDNADLVPDDVLQEQQASAKVDVFYIYPTLHRKHHTWNAALDDDKLNKMIAKYPLRHQAGVFNESCRVFAPYYRQAHIWAFYTRAEYGKEALEFAYQDIKKAFEYYIAHYNNGRPFIIAGHSQGTRHAIRLLMEYIDGKPLQEQLVAAYLPGMPVRRSYFNQLKPCQSPNETGCYNTWNTYVHDYVPDNYDLIFKGAVTSNTISWTLDSTYANPSSHRGLLNRTFKRIIPRSIGAQTHGGILWVDKVKEPRFFWARFVKNWHPGDYNLFYMDIRENVKLRVSTWLRK